MARSDLLPKKTVNILVLKNASKNPFQFVKKKLEKRLNSHKHCSRFQPTSMDHCKIIISLVDQKARKRKKKNEDSNRGEPCAIKLTKTKQEN